MSGVQKVEETAVGNKQFLIAVVADLEKHYGYKRYKVEDTMAHVQRREGQGDVVTYLKGKYLG